MTEKSAERALNPTVVKLGLVSFFADVSSELLYPITPIFLSTILGASMASIGFVEGFAEMIASLLKTYSGAWSDRIRRRKPFLVVGYFLAAIAKPLTGAATSWVHVFLARGLDRTGKGIRGAPRDALLAEAVVPELRGAAFGWHRAMDTIGATVGPLLAVLYLSYHSDDLRSIYYWALLPGALSVLFVLSIKEKLSHKEMVTKSRPHGLPWRDLPFSFKNYLLAWGVFSIANSSDVFLLMRAKQQGLSLNVVIFMYCFYNLTYSIMSPYLGKLSDRIPRKQVLMFGLLVFSLVYSGFSLASQSWHFWILFGAYGFYMAATDGVGKALAIDLVDPKLKATSLGLLGTVTGVSTLVASTIAGQIWDHLGAPYTFAYGVAGAIASIVLLTGIKSNVSFVK